MHDHWVERTLRSFSSWLAIDGGARRRVRAPELPILVDEDVGLKSESFSIVTAGAIAGQAVISGSTVRSV